MTNTPATPRRRSGGLGGLLTARPADEAPQDAPAPAPVPAEAPAPAAPASDASGPLWIATDDATGKELTRVHAPNETKAAAQVAEDTGQRKGFSLIRADEATGEPAARPGRAADRTAGQAGRAQPGLLPRAPRRKRQRPAKEKLTVDVPVVVLDALAELVDRDGTRRYDEVEEALRAHLTAKGVDIEEEE